MHKTGADKFWQEVHVINSAPATPTTNVLSDIFKTYSSHITSIQDYYDLIPVFHCHLRIWGWQNLNLVAAFEKNNITSCMF